MQRPKSWRTRTSAGSNSSDSEEKSYRTVFIGAAIYIVVVVALFIGVIAYVTTL